LVAGEVPQADAGSYREGIPIVAAILTRVKWDDDGVQYHVPVGLAVTFDAVLAEVCRDRDAHPGEYRPGKGLAFHLLFSEYIDRSAWPRYEGRGANMDSTSLGGGLIYDLSRQDHSKLTELQKKARCLGIEVCVRTPNSGHMWCRAIPGAQLPEYPAQVVDTLVCEVLDVE
jgi:hypothetical protein